MNKILKIFTIIVLIIVAFIIIVPIIFEDKIINLVKSTFNNNVNATLDFENADLSIWSSFPNTEVSLEGVSLVTKAPFDGDTLFSAKRIDLKMPLNDLFKKSSDISITRFEVDKAIVALRIDSLGNVNYDIEKGKNARENASTSPKNSFQLQLKSYKIKNSIISYLDASNKMFLEFTDVNHSGIGNLSLEKSELKTVSTAKASLYKDSVAYLNQNALKLEALLGIDLVENKFSFLENQALINQLPLVFNGYIKVNENDKNIRMSFKTPSSDFKNFLALIPETYSKNIEGISSTGNFDVKGNIDGILDKNHIPKFSIIINSDDASFKYPDLSKSLKNITIKTEIANKTGLAKDTYAIVDKLSFKIDDEVFNANAKLMDLTENMKVTANVKGVVNLANLEKIYPAEIVKGLKGILDLDVTTYFDMHSIENHQYESTKTSGKFNLSDFQYDSKELKSPLKVSKAKITFNPKTVNLNTFDAQLGNTDFVASGLINNLLGFMFAKENIKGKFDVTSNNFSLNDFMVSKVNKTKDKNPSKTKEQIKIPSFLDCTFNAKAKTVLYDNIILKNVSGVLLIKDQTAELRNMKSTLFDGALGFNGSVSTRDSISKFQMDLDVNSFNIDQSFKSLALFQVLAPIAGAIDGQLNSNISLKGNLNNDFTLDLNSLSGDLLAELLSSKISTEKTPLLQSLEENLPFLDTKKLKLNNLKTAFSFKDGKVNLKPFRLRYEDIEIGLSGGHGFDTSLAYEAVIDVPAKYLGQEASELIAQLSTDELQQIKIPVRTSITGKFNNPSIKTDLKVAIANLSKELVNNQKDKLINQGKEKVSSALKDLLNSKAKDTAAIDSLKKSKKDIAKDVLDGLFNRKKKKDSVN